MKAHLVLWLFLIPFYSITLGINILLVQGKCPSHQKSLLLHMKNNLYFDPQESTKLVQWNQSVDCCQWKGVTCSKEGLVTGLDLSNQSIAGGIDNSSNLFSFHHLQSLNLAHNNIGSGIPSGFQRLKSLKYLNLSNAGFKGQIPVEISQMANLMSLDLSYNNLLIVDVFTPNTSSQSFPNLVNFSAASCGLKNFPLFLRNHSSLSFLDLSDNHIHGAIPQWIWTLVYLNLSHNHLMDWEEPLQNSSFLSVIDLHSNQLQMLHPKSLYPNQIVYFDLYNNNIQGNISESICAAKRLEVLDLGNNSLAGKIPKCLITMNGSLRVLNLQRNKLIGSIDACLGPCELRILDLSSNILEGKLPKCLINCTRLEVLDVGNNQIDDNFPCWLNRISTLDAIILRSNKFHGSIECPTTYETAWPHIQIVDLAMNNFSDRIPPAVLQAWQGNIDEKTEEMARKQNEFQVQVFAYKQIFYKYRVKVMIRQREMEFVKLPALFTSVDLSCNRFEGTIPEQVGQLTALCNLNLSQNAFRGQIPSSIGNLKNLWSLDLSENSLNGEIPIQLCTKRCWKIG